MADPASKKKNYNCDFLCEGNIESFPWKDKFEKMDKVTDVLSFEWHEEIPGEEEMLGEIYIARDQVKRQAPQYGNSFFAEMKRVIVHGLLHLSGYDHIKAADRKVMRARECEFLGLDPYKDKESMENG